MQERLTSVIKSERIGNGERENSKAVCFDYRTFEGSFCGVNLSYMTVKMVRPGEDRERAQPRNTKHTK